MKFYRNPIFFLLVLLLLAVVPVFKPYVSGTADGLGHRFRLVSFYTSLAEGNIRPRWSREAALGYGAPLFLFNYPLPYYLASLFLFLGFSVNTSGQLLSALSLLGGGIGMYVAGKKLTGNTWGGLVAAIVYTYAPYHLQMTYLYDAWGEILAFAFPPWILYFIIKVLNEDQKLNIKNQKHIAKSKNIFDISSVYFIFNFLFLILFWFLFILSHNVSAVMISPVLLVFGLLFTRLHPRKFFIILNAFFLAVVISSFFWLPALLLAKDMRYLDFIRTEAVLRGAFFKPIIFQIATAVKVMREGVTHYADFTVGLPIFFLFLWSLKEIGKRKKGYFVAVLLVLLIMSLYFTQPTSNWIWNIPPFTFVLYPFRFLFLATFLGAALAGMVGGRHKAFAIILIVFALIQGKPYLAPYADIFPFPDSYFWQRQTFSVAPGTRKNMLIKEFLPKTANVAFLEEEEKTMEKRREGEIVKDRGSIKSIISRAEAAFFEIEAQEPTTLTLNRFYFPNWKGFIDGNETLLRVDQAGRMYVEIPQGMHTVQFVFGTSNVEKIANGISVIGVILLGLEVVWLQRSFKWKPR